jgi:hypothetical protein
MIIVHTYYGKNDSVDRVKTSVFDDQEAASAYLGKVPTKEAAKESPSKHWSYAEIVKNGEEIELDPPYYL